jgi:large subunit ribosomal protein L15
MQQDKLSPAPGSRHDKKRVGRGDGSGHGAYSGKGCKGQKSRSGSGPRPGFEGGQLPLIKRLPEKRGFFNLYKTQFILVNLSKLNIFEANTEVTPEKLMTARLVESLQRPIKVLAEGEINRPLVVKANRFSAAAKAKIEAAGGKAEEVEHAAKTG